MEINMTPEKAEADLLELIRLQDCKAFTLTVTCDDGQWLVTVLDMDSGSTTHGEGLSFAEAWFRQDPGWLQATEPD